MKQTNSKRVPIQLKIYALDNSNNNFSEMTLLQTKAAHCTLVAEGLFMIISKVCNDAAFGERAAGENPMPEKLIFGLAQMAEIGAALMTACSDLIDEMDVSAQPMKKAA